MTAVVLVTAAAAAGTLARALVVRRWNRPGRLPAGTLAVNLVGSLLLGLLSSRTGPAVTAAGVGGLGAMTTFSGLAAELVALAPRRPALAASYLALSLGGGVAAAAAGLRLAG